MFLCLISTSAHSYTLLRQQAGWNNKNFGSKMKCWAKDIWGRKACYLPLISHLAPLTLPLWQSFTFLLATTHQNSVDWIFGIYSVYHHSSARILFLILNITSLKSSTMLHIWSVLILQSIQYTVLVCSLITALSSIEFQPEDGDHEVIQFQLDRFVSHNQLEFDLSGEHYKVQLIPNHDMSHLPNDESASTPICHYFGYIVQPTHYRNSSNLALSLCPGRGVRGSITTHDQTISIIASTHQFTDDHLVHKQWITRPRRHLLGRYDQSKIELYVMSDPMYTKLYKDKYGSQWKTSLTNGVKDLIQESSSEYEWWNWGNAGKISLHMTTLEIFDDYTGNYASMRPKYDENLETGRTCSSSKHWSNAGPGGECRMDIHDYLRKFDTFHRANNKNGDVYVLLSGMIARRAAGSAYVGTACTSQASAVMACGPEHRQRILVVAHEIGHTLSMQHDSAIGIMGRPEKTSKMGWSSTSKRELNAYFSKTRDLACAKNGVRSFRTIDKTQSSGGSSGGSSSNSNSDCIEIRSFSSYLDGEWKKDGFDKNKPRYRNPNSRGIKWLYWTGKYWTMNNDYNDRVNGQSYCQESSVTDCDGQWIRYGQKPSNSRFSNCGGFKTDDEGLECLKENEYDDSICLDEDTYTIADVCYNDRPVYEYELDDISYHLYSDVYYQYFGNNTRERVPQWIISLNDVASRDIVATCDQSDLLECVYGEWQVVREDNDTISMIIDEQMNVQNGRCGARLESNVASGSATVIVWICVVLIFVLVLSMFGLFIYRRRSKHSKEAAVNIGDESEEEEVEVSVDTKLTETQ